MPSFPLRKSAADALLAKYEGIINKNSTIEIIDKVKIELQEKIKVTEQLAMQAYRSLGVEGGTLEELEANLNRKIQLLQQETAFLNGDLLQRSFVDALKDAPTMRYNEQAKYEAFLRYIQNGINEDFSNSEDKWAQISIAAMTEVLGNGQGNYTVTSQGSSSMVRDSGGRFVSGLLGKEFKKLGEATIMRLSKWFREHPEIINENIDAEYSDESVRITTGWEGMSVESFLKMKNTGNKRERDRFFQNYPDLKYQIIEKYKQKILSYATGISGEHRPYFEQAINEIIFARLNGQDVDALFGMTDKSLIGLLGEVQALFFTLALTNGRNGARWIGGIGTPHADLLLKNALSNFGIQVKNSSLEGSKQEVAFRNFNTSVKAIEGKGRTKYVGNHIFDYMNTSYASAELDNLFSNSLLPNSSGLAEAIETVLGMYTFNVEYQWELKEDGKRYYYEDDNPDFRPTREKIEELSNKAQQIMDLFSIALMYMQTAQFSNGESNTLYLIAGSTMISSASILKQIVEEINMNLEYEARSFKVSMNSLKPHGAGNNTIVDVFNRDARISGLHFMLQSSYTFTKN